MIPMAVRLIFAHFACFLLSINSAVSQMQNHGGHTNQFQHNFAYGSSYAYKWEMPFTYTFTIPPFHVDANQYNPAVAQVRPQPMDVSNPYYSTASSTQQQQPSLQTRFGEDQANVWQNQGIQPQQQPSLQSRFGDEDDQQTTTARPQQTILLESAPGQTQAGFVRLPIFDDKDRQIGWMYSAADQQNNPQNSFASVPSFGSGVSSGASGFGGGQVPQSTEPTQPVQNTQIFTTDSIPGSPYRPQSSTVHRRNPMQPPPAPPPSQSSINQIQLTELSQQPTMFYNSQFGQQTAGGASGAADPSKMCTAEQISSNLCPGSGSAGAHPSVSGVNFFTGQQGQDIDRLLQSLQQGTSQTLSSVRQNAQFTPVYSSGDPGKPAVVVGSSVSGGPGGGIHSYAFTKA